MTPTVGSVFSGYGGLDMAIAAVFGAEPIWFADNDPDAARVLAHHWPHVPNLGDVTTIDWASQPRPDIIAGGFPCTDISAAGKQLGLIRYGHRQTRSGLWAEMCRAIDILRPTLVVAENVRNLTSVKADCDVEFCPWCMGDADPERVLRALGAVLGDLADIGYDAVWCGLPAAAVGAPHNRYRIFILAWPTVAVSGSPAGDGGPRLSTGQPAAGGWGGSDHHGAPAARAGAADAHTDGARREGVGPLAAGPELDDAQRDRAPAALAADRRRGVRDAEPARQQGRPDAGTGDSGAVPDADGGELRQQPEPDAGGSGPAFAQGDRAGADGGGGRPAAADAAGPRRRRPRRVDTGPPQGTGSAPGWPVGRGGDGADADADGSGFGADDGHLPGGQSDAARGGRRPAGADAAAADPDGDGRARLGRQCPGGCDADRCGDPHPDGHPDQPAARQPAVWVEPYPAAEPERGGWGRGAHQPQRSAEGRDAAAGDSAVDWGIYEPAIRRWELILGRAAPPPAARTSRRGGYQLTGEFDEWMMGLAAGHVTDPAIWRGVKRTAARNAQLRLCGNGVVPQQAVEALRRLLPYVLAATRPSW